MNEDTYDALLDGAIEAVHAERIPAELQDRCLSKARRNAAPSGSRPKTRSRRLVLPWRIAVGMAVAASLAVWVTTWVVEPPLAMAQIRAALENVKSLHVQGSPNGYEFTTDLYYRQDTGYKYVSPEWVVVDDGEHRYEYDVPKKKVTQYTSHFIQKEYVSLEALGNALGFRLTDTIDEVFKRTPELDDSIDGRSLKAYAWRADLGESAHRYVWYVDSEAFPAMFVMQFRRQPDAEWEIRNKVQICLEEVPQEKLEADFPADVQLVQQASPVTEIDGKVYEESVLEAAEAIRAQWPDYYGWEFELEIDVHRMQGPDVVVAPQRHSRGFTDKDVHYRDVFAILPPRKEGERPRRFWKRYQKDSDGKDQLLAACAFDGEVSRLYSHRPGDADRGCVFPWEHMTPLDDMPNYFDKMLMLRLNLIEDLPKFAFDVERYRLEAMHLIQSERRDDWTDQTYEAKYQGGGSMVEECTIEVAGEPCWRIRGYQYDLQDSDGKQTLLKVTMDNLEKFDGGWYPVSGRYQEFAYGLGGEVDYRFEVTKVTKLPKDAEDRWWIEWPNGTLVTDQVKWENQIVPNPPVKVEPRKLPLN